MRREKTSRNHSRNWVASYDKWSVCIMASTKGSPIMRFCKKNLRKYWLSHDYAITYLLTDIIIACFYKKNKMFKNVIDNTDDNNNHMFEFVDDGPDLANDICDMSLYEEYRKDTWMFKMTYKYNYFEKLNGQKTYYGMICEEALD